MQGRIINNVLNKKFVTLPCNGVGLSPSFDGVLVFGGCRDGRELFSLGVGAWGHVGCGVSCQTLALDLK